MGLVAKLVGLAAILFASYFAVLSILLLIDSFALYLGLGFGAPGSPFPAEAVSLVTTISVLIVFTVPAFLAMFGHAGTWFRHVISKSAKWLGVALTGAVLLDFGSEAFSAVQVRPGLVSGTEAVSLVAVFGILVLGFGSPLTLLRLAEAAVGAATRLPRMMLRVVRRKENSAAVELQLAPTKRLRERDEGAVMKNEALRFQRLAHSLASLGCTVEFGLRFRERRGKALLMARGREEKAALELRLLSVAKAYLYDSKPVPVREEAAAALCRCTVRLSGPPELSPDPLEPLARFFIENGFEGDYSVVIRRHLVNPVSKLIAAREQRRLAKESGKQKSSTSLAGVQTSTTVQDHSSQVEQEGASKEVERRSSGQALEAWVFITAHGRTIGESAKTAQTAAETLRSSLSSHRQKQELKLRRCRRPFASLSPRGGPSVILPSEAAPLVWIPQMSMGTQVEPSVEFELPPELPGEIELGEVVTRSGRSGHMARVRLDDLTSHIFYSGKTGSGKTTSCFALLLALHRLGVPFLVVEPVKAEYRSLAGAVRGLQVFTLGDEDTAPFRLNIFEPPQGVKVQTHLENLEAAWTASFTMYAPLPYMIKPILFETYRAAGWDVKGDRRGRPVTLADFLVQAEKAARSSGYEPKVAMDIEAALRNRIVSLTYGAKGDMFNAVSSIPVEVLLRRPTVLELKGITNSEEKAFVAALILSNVAEYVEAKGESKQLRHLTLVEEAHRLVPNVSTEKGDPEAADSRRRMVEQFGDMLAEVRAYGEGLAIVEQIPTKILPDAIKNTGTKVAHRVPADDDRRVLAGAMGMTEEQSQVLVALKPGEAVVHVPSHPLPVRVVVPDRAAELGMRAGEMGDEAVRELMTEFYLKNPLPRAPSSIVNEKLRTIVDSEWFRVKFVKGYREMLRSGSPDALLDLATEVARRLSGDSEEFSLNTERLLRMGAEFHLGLDDEDRVRFPREAMRYMERAASGRRG